MNLLKAASTISLLTLTSRITGLVREIMVATFFGASAWTDAFNVAFRLPNLLRRMFAEGAFSQAFVPLLSQTRQTKSPEQTQELIDQVSTALFWILAVISLAGVLLAPVLVWLTASGLHPEAFDAAIWMTRLMFPYAGLISLVALSAGILNTWKHFAVPAVTPALLNLAIIGSAVAFHKLVHPPIDALAIGVMIGGVAQLAVQWPALRRYAVVPRFRLSFLKAWRSEGVHRVVKQMLPASLSVSVAQVSIVINTQIASHLHAGSVSWLAYADRLMEFPTAILGVALTQDVAKYSTLLDWGLRLTLVLALPSAIALLIFAQPLVAMLYNYGRFDHADVLATTSALRAYGIGLIALIGIKILAPGFYARQDLRTPVKIALVVLVCTQLMNLLFVPWLGHAGLALAISIGALLNASLLFRGLRKRGMFQPQPGWGRYAGKVTLAQVPLGGLMLWGAVALPWDRAHGDLLRLGMGLGLLAGAAVLYFATLRLLGFRLRQFMHSE
ncbi:MAG: murein biosynthesis integral membrane protein MurJ [Thiomonas sp. 20-64-5]|nr:MAG: murein biosynthesis integral membrane protein MurJ [Thiomonas sp. 20-64-5]